LTFEEAISKSGRKRVREAPDGVHRVYSYVERSLYAEQIERLLDIFPRRQIHFFRTDKLWRDFGNTLENIETFLGVDHLLRAIMKRTYIVPVDGSDLGGLPAGLRSSLDGLFRSDIRRTAELTGLDLSDWLRPDYQEPMRRPTVLRRWLANIRKWGRAAA